MSWSWAMSTLSLLLSSSSSSFSSSLSSPSSLLLSSVTLAFFGSGSSWVDLVWIALARRFPKRISNTSFLLILLHSASFYFDNHPHVKRLVTWSQPLVRPSEHAKGIFDLASKYCSLFGRIYTIRVRQRLRRQTSVNFTEPRVKPVSARWLFA